MSSPVEVVWARNDGSAGQAESLLRQEIAAAYGSSADDVGLTRLCPSCGSTDHGKPVVTGPALDALQVSLSRCEDLVVVAFTIVGAIGVDVERADAASFNGFDAVALHPEESASTVRDRAITWVRKESLLKALGHGLVVDPTSMQLSEPGAPPALIGWSSTAPKPKGVWMEDLVLDEEHVAALTVLGNPEAVRLREVPGVPSD